MFQGEGQASTFVECRPCPSPTFGARHTPASARQWSRRVEPWAPVVTVCNNFLEVSF